MDGWYDMVGQVGSSLFFDRPSLSLAQVVHKDDSWRWTPANNALLPLTELVILNSGRFRRHYHIIMFGNYFEPWKCAFLHVNLHPVFPEQNIVLSLRLLNLYQIVSHFTSFQPGNFQGIVSPLTINSTVMSHLAPSASKHRILRVLLYVKHDMAL